MIPINVTHTAIATREIRWNLLSPAIPVDLSPDTRFPKAHTNLRHTLSTLINFFADAYESTFGFTDGPPLHDALTIAYVSAPELFQSKRYRVDVELTGVHSIGQTVVDVWQYTDCDDTWGSSGRNCLVTEKLDVRISGYILLNRLADVRSQVPGFFKLFLDCVAKCDDISPLNVRNVETI